MKKRYTWVTADGKIYLIKKMTIKHLNNILKMLHGKGNQEFPEYWNGISKREWIMIFNDERDERLMRYIFKPKNKTK